MTNKKILFSFLLVFTFSFFLYGCTTKNKPKDEIKNNEASVDEDVAEFEIYGDKLANSPIKITQTKKFNEEFKVKYKTYQPDGEGEADFKSKPLKVLSSLDDRLPQDGYKLVLAEISVKGNASNKGRPFTFNQIGDYPSPQFVLIDKDKNISQVETTYFSDIYTVKNDMYELSKISMDSGDWVHTAIVFEVEKDFPLELALRFTNSSGEIEFYGLSK